MAQTGNQNARRGGDWRKALQRALDQYSGPKASAGTALARIAETVVDKALDGDRDAIQEIANRLDGKPVQATELTGADGGPTTGSITLKFGSD